MKKSNACVLSGKLSVLSSNEWKYGVRGWLLVGSQKVRFDVVTSDKTTGEVNPKALKLVKAVLSANGKMVQVLGHVEDGSYANENGEVVTGNRFCLERIREVEETAERISFRFNAIRHGSELYYSKPVGHGCLKFNATVSNLDTIPEDKLVLVTLVKTMGKDEFGFRTTKTEVTAVESAYTGDEYGVFTVADVEKYPKLRTAYEQKLRERAAAQAASKK